MAVTVELVLLSRVSYGSLEITGSRLQGLLALLAEDLGGPLAAARGRSPRSSAAAARGSGPPRMPGSAKCASRLVRPVRATMRCVT